MPRTWDTDYSLILYRINQSETGILSRPIRSQYSEKLTNISDFWFYSNLILYLQLNLAYLAFQNTQPIFNLCSKGQKKARLKAIKTWTLPWNWSYCHVTILNISAFGLAKALNFEFPTRPDHIQTRLKINFRSERRSRQQLQLQATFKQFQKHWQATQCKSDGLSFANRYDSSD